MNKFFSRRLFSTFGHLKPRPADPILGIVEEFKKCDNPNKVNLSAGTYKCDAGKPYILNCVKEAQKRILDQNIDHEYLPIEGISGFINNSLKLAYGEQNQALKDNRVVGLQALSGTGSLRVGMEFFSNHYPGNKQVFIPNPSWPNHKNIVNQANLEFKEYRYYDRQNKKLDLQGMLEDLDKAPKGSIVILHVCAHNPTGMDPTRQEWDEIYRVVVEKGHLPFFDMAYQGFASGDLENDSYALRLFADKGVKLALAQSYAKNFGLYGQRVGCFSLITDSEAEKKSVQSHVKFIARAQYSNPPKYGGAIVDTVLSDKGLTQEWHREMRVMSDRIAKMRTDLFDGIKANGSTHNWDHIIKQIGMFAYTGLTPEQVQKMKEDHHIFLTTDGRISVAGLNTKNVNYVSKAIHEVTKL